MSEYLQKILAIGLHVYACVCAHKICRAPFCLPWGSLWALLSQAAHLQGMLSSVIVFRWRLHHASAGLVWSIWRSQDAALTSCMCMSGRRQQLPCCFGSTITKMAWKVPGWFSPSTIWILKANADKKNLQLQAMILLCNIHLLWAEPRIYKVKQKGSLIMCTAESWVHIQAVILTWTLQIH